ncbi:MAG: hypothetical protein ACI9HK_005675 [Pirellulaceae bacterium]|jgi:hypothetical protein
MAGLRLWQDSDYGRTQIMAGLRLWQDSDAATLFTDGSSNSDLNPSKTLKNAEHGVFIDDATFNLIGGIGDSPLLGNAISSTLSGIRIEGQLATQNQIFHNFIGTDAAGNLSNPVSLLGSENTVSTLSTLPTTKLVLTPARII